MSEPGLRPSRRVTLAWMLAAASGPLALAGCGPASGWRELRPAPIDAPGYGGDPNLIDPATPWPLTLSEAERDIVRIAADIIVPAQEASPGAGALGVEAFVDEWVSAPYPAQQADRPLILSGLRWLAAEAQKRFGAGFAAITDAERRAIFDDVAFRERVKPGYDKPAEFFARLRALVLAGYYSLPEGIADIGYVGNVPIVGPYPGPSDEALAHLRERLAELGLSMPD